MARFKDIIGQDLLSEHLQNAIKLDKVSHAYLINGERYMGKEWIARIYSMALQCERPEGTEPCQECRSCKQALGDNHPDIRFITHEKPNTIGVEEIRNQINADVAVKPYSGPKKIYIVGEAEKMTVQAQNALLKTLEEPPGYAVILLLTANADSLLPTIISRCVLLHMKPVADQKIRSYLMESLGMPDYKADLCVAFARGNPGKAKLLAASEEFEKVKEEAVALLKNIGNMEIHEMLQAIKKIQEFPFEISDYLDLLSVWYRDVLILKATQDVSHLIFREELPHIKRVADTWAYEGIEEVIRALEKAKIRLSANVNFELTMELLLLAIKENE